MDGYVPVTQHAVDRLAQAIVEGRTNDAYEELRQMHPDRVPHIRVTHMILAGRAKKWISIRCPNLNL